MKNHQTIGHLPDNARFYILASSLLFSTLVLCWVRLVTPSDQLFYIRSEQIFGYLAIFYWYVALIVSPLSSVVGKVPLLTFSRRAIGVSAAYFAALHGSIALWGQIGGFGGLLLLPPRFRLSLGFGAVALATLALMAVTSFDKVISFMTLRRWKWLHRLGYGGGVLAMMHVWMVGTHMVYGYYQIIAFMLLSLLFGLESVRIAKKLAVRGFIKLKFVRLMSLVVWISLSALLLILPNVVGSYHDKHEIDAEHLKSTEH